MQSQVFLFFQCLIWKFMTEYGYCTQDYTLSSHRENLHDKKNAHFKQELKQPNQNQLLQTSKFNLIETKSGVGQNNCQLHKKSWQMNMKKQNTKNIQKSMKQLGKKVQQDMKKQKNFQLDEQEFKKKMQNYRISNLIKQFTLKLKRTSISKSPTIYNPFQSISFENGNSNGVQLSQVLLILFLAISSLLIFVNCLLSTFLLIFKQTQWFQGIIFPFSVLNICWTLFQTIFGFVRVREEGNKKLTKIKEISAYYIKNELGINLVYLTCTILSSLTVIELHQIPNLLTLIKIGEGLKKSKIVESKLINFIYQEQYWNLFKMFLYNFIFAHIVATVLFMMADLEENSNWMKIKKIDQSTQFQKYSWAYYWATTIILSVGFGDIVASNPKEAIILVVVEIIGCMALAFNINRIGHMLNHIQQKQSEKQKKVKLLKQMCNRNQIQKNLQFKLTNYIKESYTINDKFNFDESIKLVSKLPTTLQQEYKRSSNRKIIQQIGFLRNFTNKSVLRIAEKLQQKMLHPWQTLFNPFQCKDILILQQGSIGLCANFGISKFNQIVIDQFLVNDRGQSLLVSLDFIRPPSNPKNYDYRAIKYSIIGSIGYSEFIQILKLKNVDSEFFYSLRDKQRRSNDDFQLLNCKQCQTNHSKFTCPKLHFCPIHQQVIYKHLMLQRNSKASRFYKERAKQQTSALKFHSAYEVQLNSGQISSQGESRSQKYSNQKLKTMRYVEFKYPDLNDSIFMGTFNRNNSSRFTRERTKVYIRNSFGDTKLDLMKKSQAAIKCMNSLYIFDVWHVQLDKVHDFKFYFPESNSKQLQNTSLKSKMSYKKMGKSTKMKATMNKKIFTQ